MGTAGTMGMMQIGVILMRLEESIKYSQKQMQVNIKEESKNTREGNQSNFERIEYNMRSLEKWIESKMKSQAEEHSVSLQELEFRIYSI